MKDYISTAEAARILGVSRVAVFKKIKNGQIKAQKIGRNFVIRKEDILELSGAFLTTKAKAKIEKAVDRVIKEYGETLRLLGQE